MLACNWLVMDRLRRGFLIAAGGLLTSVAHPGLILAARATASFKETITTLFWVGETAGEENAFISNEQSYWDQDWLDHYGGVDDPERRSTFAPSRDLIYAAVDPIYDRLRSMARFKALVQKIGHTT